MGRISCNHLILTKRAAGVNWGVSPSSPDFRFEEIFLRLGAFLSLAGH